jgi:hypothetical protein
MSHLLRHSARRLAGAAAAQTLGGVQVVLGRCATATRVDAEVAVGSDGFWSNKRGASSAGAVLRGALAPAPPPPQMRARGYATATVSSSAAAVASGGGDGGGGDRDGPTATGNMHAEASSDRVGAGLRGDGTAPRFYKKVDVVRREGGGVFLAFPGLKSSSVDPEVTAFTPATIWSQGLKPFDDTRGCFHFQSFSQDVNADAADAGALYDEVQLEGGWGIALDGKTLKTPKREPLSVGHESLPPPSPASAPAPLLVATLATNT